MPWRGPEYAGEFPTLGWHVLAQMSLLPSPVDEEEPFVLTDEQARIILDWYRINPERGKFFWRRGCLQQAKGWGKSPLLAALAIIELAGEVRFDGWDAKGEPVARPWGTGGDPTPWVQIAAVSEDQTDNTYDALYAFLAGNDGKAADEFDIDLGLGRLYLRSRQGKLTPVTSAKDTREGQRVTFAVKDETHLWLPSKGGPKLSRTLNRNAAKMDGRTFESTNAFVPGEDSVAESTKKAADSGKPGIYFYSVEAPEVEPDDDDETLRAAFKIAYGDSWWVSLDRLVEEARDPDVPWEDVLRFNCNRIVKGINRAVDPATWSELTRERPEDGAYIGVGFDGSESDDHTGMIGTTLDGRQFVLGHWDPADYPDGRIPRLEVDEAVARVFDRWHVGRFLFDPAMWGAEGERWARRYGEDVVLEFPQTVGRMGPATERWLLEITNGELTHDGDPTFAAHVVSAHRKRSERKYQGRYWPLLTKNEHRRKIDLAVTAVMSLEAAATMPEQADAVAPEPFFIKG